MSQKEAVALSLSLKDRLVQQVEINSGHINKEIAGFSKAFKESDRFNEIVSAIVMDRKELSPLHFGLLAYSSYKYAFFLTNGFFDKNSTWDDVVDWCNGENGMEIVLESLRYKNVNITSPHRYEALRLAIERKGDFKGSLSIADVGCGFYPFGIGYSGDDCYLVDEFGIKIKSNNLVYSRIEAMDYQDLDPVWTAASKWEPINMMRSRVDEYRGMVFDGHRNLNFYKVDITRAIPDIQPVDFCFVGNVLYQIREENRNAVIENLEKILKPNGYLLTADFLPGGSRRRPFTYGICAYKNNTGLSLENGEVLLLLENADCKKVRIA